MIKRTVQMERVCVCVCVHARGAVALVCSTQKPDLVITRDNFVALGAEVETKQVVPA